MARPERLPLGLPGERPRGFGAAAGVERSGIRTYLALHEAGGRVGFFRKSAFAYDARKDLYICPAGETLRALGDAHDRRSRGKVVTYRVKGSICAVCSLKPQCTTNKNGRSLRRGPGDEYIDLLTAGCDEDAPGIVET